MNREHLLIRSYLTLRKLMDDNDTFCPIAKVGYQFSINELIDDIKKHLESSQTMP